MWFNRRDEKKKIYPLIKRCGFLLLLLLLLVSCGQSMSAGNLKKAGLLVPDTINDQVWGTKGYKGMLKIQSHYNVEVYYKEGMDTQPVVERAVKEFDQKGVNIIFGHGNEYAEYFNELSEKYPHIHFVSFNGNAENVNTTSLNFEGFAMGFFGGMMAAHMSKTDTIGVIAAYEWQPEVKGFYEGAKYEKKNIKVVLEYVGDWDDNQKAITKLEQLFMKKADVIYPAGDSYNVTVIEKVKEKGHYAIGYISDQADLGESVVLTSTVQHVDDLYELVAEKFNNGDLQAGNLSFDFQDGVISLGKFSTDVDKKYIHYLNNAIEKYKKTGKLPNE